MTGHSPSDDLFFTASDLTRERAMTLTEDALGGADDGDLFLEYRQSENLVFDDGQLRTASFDVSHGFGLRAVSGEASAYAHSAEISEAAIRRAGETVRAVRSGSGSVTPGPARTNVSLYAPDNPVEQINCGIG